eukprot:scaffold1618_cov158-Ochromonas_danica.AAC.12
MDPPIHGLLLSHATTTTNHSAGQMVNGNGKRFDDELNKQASNNGDVHRWGCYAWSVNLSILMGEEEEGALSLVARFFSFSFENLFSTTGLQKS